MRDAPRDGTLTLVIEGGAGALPSVWCREWHVAAILPRVWRRAGASLPDVRDDERARGPILRRLRGVANERRAAHHNRATVADRRPHSCAVASQFAGGSGRR